MDLRHQGADAGCRPQPNGGQASVIAKMCSAGVPARRSGLTFGSTTARGCLPCWIGTANKNRLTGVLSRPAATLRYGATMAASGWLPYQSGTSTENACDDPSGYSSWPSPVPTPQVLVPRNASRLPEPESRRVWPDDTALSRSPGVTSGQVKRTPSWVITAPGGQPTEASACADRLDPYASTSAAAGFASSAMPALLNAERSDRYGSVNPTVARTASEVHPVTSKTPCPVTVNGPSASARTVTRWRRVAEPPGGRLPRTKRRARPATPST